MNNNNHEYDDKDLGPADDALGPVPAGSETHLPKGDLANTVDDVAADAKLSRGLKPRHVTMISLGGVLYVPFPAGLKSSGIEMCG